MLQVMWDQFQSLLGLGLDVGDVSLPDGIPHDHYLCVLAGDHTTWEQALSGPSIGIVAGLSGECGGKLDG